MNTTRELIDAHPFLAGLDPAARHRLAGAGHRIHFLPGSPIFAEGGRADRFWLIQEGHVRLEMHLPGSGPATIETLASGDVLGWSWLFPPYRWQFGAIAVDPTLAVELDGPAVRQICDHDPALGYELMQRFMRLVVHRLQATRVRLLDMYGQP
jgi:CRP/FNR family cyclic AMP-dependent transcriptional regulator